MLDFDNKIHMTNIYLKYLKFRAFFSISRITLPVVEVEVFPKRLGADLLFEPRVELVPNVEPLFVFPKLNVILKYSFL